MIYIVVGIAYTQRVDSNLVKLRVTRTACEYFSIDLLHRSPSLKIVCPLCGVGSATPTQLETEVLQHHLPATNWPNKTDLGRVSRVSCLVPPTRILSQSCSSPSLSVSLCVSLFALCHSNFALFLVPFALPFDCYCSSLWAP